MLSVLVTVPFEWYLKANFKGNHQWWTLYKILKQKEEGERSKLMWACTCTHTRTHTHP